MDEYQFKVNISLAIKAKDYHDAENYLSDFIQAMNEMIYSSDEDDDHYEIQWWNAVYNGKISTEAWQNLGTSFTFTMDKDQ